MTFNLIPSSNFAKAIKKKKEKRKMEMSTIIDRFVPIVTRARGEKSMADVYSLTRQEFERASRDEKNTFDRQQIGLTRVS